MRNRFEPDSDKRKMHGRNMTVRLSIVAALCVLVAGVGVWLVQRVRAQEQVASAVQLVRLNVTSA